MPRTIVHVGRKIQVAIDESLDDHGRLVRRDVVLHPGAVAILPLVDEDHVCLIRNVRPNVGQTLWEIPAGTLEPPEPPEAAAFRELTEETGYVATTMTKQGEFFPSPGVLSERTHLFVATGLTPGPQRLEADEQIEAHVIALHQAYQWCLDGTIRDAKTLVALLGWQVQRRA
jgi:ADP-ribose pyrophosphatase